MSDQPETLAAVLAEMRDFAKPLRVGGDLCSNVALPATISIWASRIEAAAERERNAHTNDIHDALYKATGIPGNAAALREALGKLTDAVREYFGWDDAPAVQDRDDPTAYFCAEMSAALAALAAPARNCDRYATAAKAMHEWERYKVTAPIPPGGWCLGDAFTWLFDKAEGVDHA